MGASNDPRLPLAKPEPRRKTKARKKRRERGVITDVRQHCVTRDGYCRLFSADAETKRTVVVLFGECAGPSEWAHFGDKKRAKTRGMEPEDRHTPEGSLMLCRKHHDDYDDGIMAIDALTDRGCQGRLVFRRDDEFVEQEDGQ